MTIRLAMERDAIAIGRVQVETWRAAYQGIVPAAVLDALSARERGDAWRPVLAGRGMPSMLLWVFDANAPARRFYESLGGAVVRNQSMEIGGVALAEVAYGWPRVDVLLVPPCEAR